MRKPFATAGILVCAIALLGLSIFAFQALIGLGVAAIATGADGRKHPEVPFQKIDSDQLAAAARRNEAIYQNQLEHSSALGRDYGPSGRVHPAK